MSASVHGECRWPPASCHHTVVAWLHSDTGRAQGRAQGARASRSGCVDRTLADVATMLPGQLHGRKQAVMPMLPEALPEALTTSASWLCQLRPIRD